MLDSLLPARWLRARLLRAAAGAPQGCAAGPRQLLVDVSEISRADAGTGIQRVVRNVLLHLLRSPPPGYVVRPVHASRSEGYRYAVRYQTALLAQPDETPDLPVRVAAGDVFLGLDLAASLIPRHRHTLGRWKRGGVRLHFLAHDLLPVRQPQWFSPKRPRVFRRWLRAVAILADSIVCVSQATADDLAAWLERRYGIGAQSLPVSRFHPGSDLPAAMAPAGCGPQVPHDRRTVLMVGTIEPRKAHAQALAAFEQLWREGGTEHLVIVGKAGWKVDALVARLRRHPQAGIRLHWIENCGDAELSQWYAAVSGVLMASEGEGFGLPIIEAAGFGKPLLLRDLPVFREVAGAGACYFSGTVPAALAQALRGWLAQIEAGQAPLPRSIHRPDWAESTAQLLCALRLD